MPQAQRLCYEVLHLEHDTHPHYRQQLFAMRQYCWWPGIAKDIREFEKRCECSAWKTRTHYHYGPLQLFSRPTEPNVTWHMDFICNLPEIKVAATGVCLNSILSVVDAMSGMVWLLPVSNTISARETGELILRRIMLEDARGQVCQLVCDRDERFAGEAMRHIYELNGCRVTL